jgi:molybdate-binding protein
VPADGIVVGWRGAGVGRAAVHPLREAEAMRANLLVAGCDPALALLGAHMIEHRAHVRLHWIEAASEAALEALAGGRVHVAGLHLRDPSGDFNLPVVRARFGDRPMLVVTLAVWQQGLVVRPGNPRRLRRAGDLRARGVRVVLRERGSGARALLDRLLAQLRLPLAQLDVAATVYRHAAVARAVAAGTADVGVATRGAAAALGLDFVPLAEDRFDLVMPAAVAQTPSGRCLLETLASARFRKDLGAFAGYRTAATGHVIEGAAA